jgi:sigma-B regulation protein RsbU (phosphoserine phosphatase)
VSIEVICKCGHTFHAKDRYAGKRGQCPGCGQTVQVPGLRVPALAPRALAEPEPPGQEAKRPASKWSSTPVESHVVRGRMAQTQRLMLAKWIQERLSAASPIQYGPFEVAGICSPSSQAGGDYFDFLNLQDGSLGIVIGDASGHGVESALLMSHIRIGLRALAQNNADVGKIFERANRLLLNELPPDTFATVGLARLDETTRRLTYVGAGQPPVFILNTSGKTECVLQSCEAPLGLAADSIYGSSDPQRLNPGDAVLLLTRGLLRAPAADGQPFGSQRLLELVHANRRKPAAAILEVMQHFVRNANKSRPQTDDLTAVLILAK